MLKAVLERAAAVRALYAAARVTAGRDQLSRHEEDEVRERVAALDRGVPYARSRHLRWIEAVASK